MIKGILEKLIHQKLGMFIKNLTSQQLKTDLFGGEVTLTNVELNQAFFNQKLSNTFIQLDYTSIGRLFVQAPLTKLSTVPVTLLVDDVYILLSTKNFESLIPKDSKQPENQRQKLLVSYIKKLFEKMMQNLKDKEDQGYLSKIMNRVIDNLTIKISNVHVRIQHVTTDITKSYSTGITIEEVSLRTADQNWKVNFIDRYEESQKSEQQEKESKLEKVRKLVNVSAFNWYWESFKDFSRIVSIKNDVKVKYDLMKIICQEQRKKSPNPKVQLLSLTSQSKILINPKKDLKNPLIETSLDLKPIIINVQEECLSQILQFSNNLSKKYAPSHEESSIQEQKNNLLKEFSNPNHKKLLEKVTQQIVLAVDPEKQSQDFEDQILKKLNYSKEITCLVQNYEIEFLLEESQSLVKAQVIKIKEKKLKKQTKGWFSKERELTEKEKKQLQALVEETFIQAQIKRPKGAPFIKANLFVQKFELRVSNTSKQYIIFAMNEIAFSLTLSRDFKSCYLTSSLASIQLYYLSSENTKTILVKNFGMKGNKKLIDFELKLLEKQKVKSTKIKADVAKILVNYEHFLVKKITDFLGSVGKGKTQDLAKMMAENNNRSKLNPQKKEALDQKFDYLFEVNVQLSSPTILLPVEETEYVDSGHNSIIQLRTKKCWVLDLGYLSVKNQKHTSTHLLELKDVSLKYCKTFDLEGDSVSEKECTYSFIHGLNVQGSVHISDKNELDLKLGFQEVELSMNYTQYKKILKIVQLFRQFLVQKKNSEMDQILMNSIWQGQIKKKEYKIHSGYVYVDYFAILTSEKLYLYQKQGDLNYKESLSLKQYQVKSKPNKLKQKENSISEKSSEISENIGFYSKIIIETHNKTCIFKVSNQDFLNFQPKLIPLLAHKQNLSRLQKIVQEIDEGIRLSKQDEQEEDVFEDFDEVQGEGSVIETSIRRNVPIQYANLSEKYSSSPLFNKIHFSFELQKLILRYDQDHTDQKCQHKSSQERTTFMYDVWIRDINVQITHIPGKKSTNLKFSFSHIDFTDYIHRYRSKTIQSLIILEDFEANINYIETQEQGLNAISEGEIQDLQKRQSLEQFEKEQISVDLKLGLLVLNWKPDVLLALVHFFNTTKQELNQGISHSQEMNAKFGSKKAVNEINIDNFIAQNPQFWQKKSFYDQQSKDKKYDRNQFFKPMEHVRLSLESTINEIEINFMHRESHLRVFAVTGNQINAKVNLNKDTLLSEVSVKDIQVIDTTSYPQKEYIEAEQHLNQDFILFGKKPNNQEENFIQMKFVKHENQLNVCNSKKINSAMSVEIEPSYFIYFQQPILRIVDYCLVQVLTLVTDYRLIQANQTLKAQLSKLKDANIEKQKELFQKQAVFVVFKEYEDLIKKILHPLFNDIQILMKQPEIILKATKKENFSVILECENVFVQNSQKIASNRANLSKLNKESIKHLEIYQQVFNLTLQNTVLYLKENSCDSKIQRQFSNVIQGNFVFSKLMFENQLQKLYPAAKLVRDLNCELKFNQQLVIPELSRATYQNLLKIANFNVTFDDRQDEKFIHNYQISKLRDPNLINFNFFVPKINMACCYDDPNHEKKVVELMKLNINNFALKFHRNRILDSEVKVNFDSLEIDYPEKIKRDQKRMIQEEMQFLENINRKSLASYPLDKEEIKPERKRDIIALHMTKRDDSKAVMVFLKNLTIFVDMKILNAAQQFFNVQKWVYPVQKETNSVMSFHCELQNTQIYVPQTNSENIQEGFLIKGIVYFQYKIMQTLTFESVQRMFKEKILAEENLNEIGEFTNMNVKMWVNFFYYRREENQSREDQLERRILELTQISFSNSLTYGYVSGEKKSDIKMQQDWSERKVMIVSDMKIHTSELRIKISLSDYMLLQKILNNFAIQKSQAEDIIKCFNKINYRNVAFYNLDKSIDEIQFEKPQTSPFSQISMEFGGVGFLVYDLKFNPIIQIKMSDFNLFQKSNSVTAQMGFQAKYFNQEIFVWEPFFEENKIIFIYQETASWIKDNHDERSDKYFELSLDKQVRINFSREFMKSLINLSSAYKKFSKIKESNSPGSMSKIQSQITPISENIKEIQFISHYVIRNETGYPIKIFSSRGKEVTIMMTGTSLPYTFEEKNSRSSQIVSDTIGFQILHEKYVFQTICGASFLLKKKMKVKLKTVDNKFLTDTISLESYCKDSKKVLLIASPKYMKDYSWNKLIETYLPFDHPNNVELTVPQKVKVSLYDNSINRNIKSEYFYRASNGCLEIKYPQTVYNFTPIPLEISGAFALPGQFVGIKEPLLIQGIFHEEQNIIKVVQNKQKQEYYLYSSAYLIDYTGTLQFAFNNSLIIKRFKYQTIQNKRRISVYLLPDVDYNFSVRWEKQKFIDVESKLGRQTIELRKGLELHQFNVFSYLSSIENSEVKELKKIIEVTESIYLVNETQYDIMLPQNNYKNEVLYLKKGQKKPFYWQDFACPKQFQVVPEIPQYGGSCMLGLENSQSFLIPHSSNHYKKGKIFSLVCQTTENIDFVVIQECLESRYEVTNTVQNSIISIYQKQNSKEKLFEVSYGQSLPFAFIANNMRSQFFVEITLDANLPGEGYISQKIKIEKFENILFEKQICMRPNSPRKAPLKWLCLQLTFENKKKRLKLSVPRLEIESKKKQRKEMQILLKMPKIFVSFIGNHECIRKEIFVLILENLGLEIIKTKKAITYSALLESLRIENLYKKNPYYEVIAYSQLTTSKCFMKFVYSQSLDSSNLIYYLGFSMGHIIVTTTSQELQVLFDNLNGIMRDKYLLEAQEHDFVHITYEQKINPSHLAQPNDFIYFVRAEIRPFKSTVTFKNISGWGGIIGKAFGNINQCKLQINGNFINNGLFPNFRTFLNVVQNYFIDSIKGELFSIVGSLTLISTPLNVASKIKTGIGNFLTLPAKNFDGNPLDLGKGVALGTGSLIKNTFQGIFQGAQSLTALIGNGISMAITDQDFNKKRAQIKNKKSSNVAEGIGHGFMSMFNGISQGITGIVTEPAKGASAKGIGGFGLGLLKGVTGLVTKPITGIVDGVSKTAQGIKNTTKIFESEQKTMKQKKTYLNRPFYGEQRSIRAYDKDLAYWNSFLEIELHEDIHSTFVYSSVFKARTRTETLVIISTFKFILVTPTYTFIIGLERAELLKTIRNEKIRKIDIDKKETKNIFIAAEINQEVENIGFLMSNSDQAKDIVKEIDVYAKPPESALSYRNDD